MSKNTETISNTCDTHNLQLEVNIESISEQIENQLANGVKIQTKNDVRNLIKLLNRNDNFNITDLNEITQYLDGDNNNSIIVRTNNQGGLHVFHNKPKDGSEFLVMKIIDNNGNVDSTLGLDGTETETLVVANIISIGDLLTKIILAEEKNTGINNCVDITIKQKDNLNQELSGNEVNDIKPILDVAETTDNIINQRKETIVKTKITTSIDQTKNVIEKNHIVIKNDTIWDILQTEQFGLTEKQANIAIKKLANNSDFLSKLKSNNIDEIYPGETITFSNKLLSSLKTQETIPEVEEGIWSYKVEKGDTPGHILMKYKGVNWGNIDSIAKELNMNVVKLGETITLAKTIILKDGTEIKKTD